MGSDLRFDDVRRTAAELTGEPTLAPQTFPELADHRHPREWAAESYRMAKTEIYRDGALVQFVPLQQRAWHAGASRWRGRERCNDFSVGIELEGTDEEPYDDRQYETLARLILALQQTYPMLADGWIAGHSDIAPGRKTDPGPAFDWQQLERAIRGRGAAFRREVLA